MGRLGGITDTLSQLLEQAGISLPEWAFPVLIGVLFLALLPLIRRNSRVHRARMIVAEIDSEKDTDRARLKAEAVALVADHPVGLVGLADEAIRRGINDLAKAALAALKTHGRPAQDIHRLQAELYGPTPAHLEGEIAAIEKLLDNGVRTAARDRLQRAASTWPDAPELRALHARCLEE